MRLLTDKELIGLAALKKRGAACPDQDKIREHFGECKECYEKFCIAFTMMDLAGFTVPVKIDVLTSDTIFEEYESDQTSSAQEIQMQNN